MKPGLRPSEPALLIPGYAITLLWARKNADAFLAALEKPPRVVTCKHVPSDTPATHDCGECGKPCRCPYARCMFGPEVRS